MVRYTLKQLTYLSTVAEHGGIAQAARHLHVSQPAIAFALAKLEKTLGLRLLIRHQARGTEMTPNGLIVLRLSRLLLNHANEIDREFTGLADTVKGRVRFACYETLAPFYVPGFLKWVRSHAPNVTLELSEGRQDALLSELTRRKVDLALLYDMDLQHRAISKIRVASLNPYILLSERHPLAGNAMVSLRQLTKEPFVMLDWPVTREFFARVLREAGLTPKTAFQSPSFELVRGAVANDLGFSLLYARPSSDLSYDGQRLVCMPIKEKLPSLNIVVAWAKQEPILRLRDKMVEMAQAYFTELNGPRSVKVQPRH